MQQNQKQISNQNIDYYDAIAINYDTILNRDTKNDFVRKKVADKLTSLVGNGLVLDFGGGTGEDLKWLLANDYSVIFCEPSSGMRNIAIEKYPNSGIQFLDDSQTDFPNWNELPFEEKVNAVIANFAVLNCILDVELFFKNLALVTASKSEILLLVLDYGWKISIRMFFDSKAIPLKTNFQDKKQLVYLHSVKSIQKAAADNFEFKSCERLKEFGFSLIHLTRK